MFNAIIFLDIDGVLNTIEHLKRQKIKTGEATNKFWDPTACKHITLLCEYYHAKIVVTSSWRHEYTLKQLQEFFASNNIPDKFIIDVTTSIAPQQDESNYCRGHEIQDWLQNNLNKTTSYIIIDDEAQFLETQQDHVVRVDKHNGFSTKKAVTKASNILEKKLI
jgi:16S rRNA C1402 (ribose-2'-O) methylase RsmI